MELACLLATECGALLCATQPRPFADVLEAFRAVLQEVGPRRFFSVSHLVLQGRVDKRTQVVVEAFLAVRRNKFAQHPALLPELDLVERADQVGPTIRVLSFFHRWFL